VIDLFYEVRLFGSKPIRIVVPASNPALRYDLLGDLPIGHLGMNEGIKEPELPPELGVILKSMLQYVDGQLSLLLVAIN
jgi:hypothetical protein